MKNILGAHVSIANGIFSAFGEAESLGCDVMQIFTKNSNQWSAKKLNRDDVLKFKEEASRTKIRAIAHDSYLINLASPKSFILEKSINALSEELERCDELDIPYLIMHPGSHMGKGDEIGIKKVAESLNKVLDKNNFKVKILLETTAGQGTNLGYSFEQLAGIRKLVGKKNQIGFCIDTCHIFAAGYDLRTKAAYEKTISDFDKICGLKNLFAIHINDSKKDLGSRVDRHEHIGKGFLGKDAFKFLLNDERLINIPKILETPNDGRGDDLGVLRGLEKMSKL
ncbi:MAG: deoxyribonuclease IV [bacterium]